MESSDKTCPSSGGIQHRTLSPKERNEYNLNNKINFNNRSTTSILRDLEPVKISKNKAKLINVIAQTMSMLKQKF